MNDSKLWAWLDQAMSGLQPWRRACSTVAAAAIVLGCWHLTYLFRLGFERWQPGRPWYDDYVSLGVVLVYLVSLAWTGALLGVWRFFGFDDIKRITLACGMAGLVSAVAVLMAQLSAVARAVLLLHPVFCLIALSFARMVYRMVWEHARAQVMGQNGEMRRAVVMGAGEAARRLVAGLHRRDGWSVVALLDDDASKQGLRIGGVPVLGPLSRLGHCVRSGAATHVIIAMPGAQPEQRAAALAAAKASRLPVLIVPSQAELQADSKTPPAT